MPSVTSSIELPASPEQVWGVVGDLSRNADWLTIHSRFPSDPPASPAVGDSYKQELKLMGMPAVVSWKVAAVEPGSQLQLDGSGPMGVKAKFGAVVEPAGDGSKLTLTTEFSGGMLMGPMAQQVEKGTKTELDKSLAKLKDLLG